MEYSLLKSEQTERSQDSCCCCSSTVRPQPGSCCGLAVLGVKAEASNLERNHTLLFTLSLNLALVQQQWAPAETVQSKEGACKQSLELQSTQSKPVLQHRGT